MFLSGACSYYVFAYSIVYYYTKVSVLLPITVWWEILRLFCNDRFSELKSEDLLDHLYHIYLNKSRAHVNASSK